MFQGLMIHAGVTDRVYDKSDSHTALECICYYIFISVKITKEDMG